MCMIICLVWVFKIAIYEMSIPAVLPERSFLLLLYFIERVLTLVFLLIHTMNGFIKSIWKLIYDFLFGIIQREHINS